MLEISGLSQRGLEPIDLRVEDGACVTIRGRSGAGKSLFLRAVADLDPSVGRVSLDNRERRSMSAPEWRRRVVFVPTESGWWDDRVGDHFEAPDIAAGYLVRLGFQSGVMEWPVSRLSTGERQRLALLRAIVLGPRVMLLDEPTSALDPDAAAKVESVLHEKLAGGGAIVMVTHDDEQARRMAEHRYQMVDGALSEDGGAPA